MSISSIGGLSSVAGSASDGAQVSATTGLVLSSDTKQARAMGYDVRNSWETSSTSVTLSDSGSVSTESATTLYTSDVQQARTAFNTSMGDYWMVETDSSEQKTTNFSDAIVNPDGSTANNVGQSTSTSASSTLSYENPFGRALTASQFNAEVKLYGTQEPSDQAGTTSTQTTGSASLSQSEDVMALLGSVPKAGTHAAQAGQGALPQDLLSASDEVAAELLTLTTGVTPQDAAAGDPTTIAPAS